METFGREQRRRPAPSARCRSSRVADRHSVGWSAGTAGYEADDILTSHREFVVLPFFVGTFHERRRCDPSQEVRIIRLTLSQGQ